MSQTEPIEEEKKLSPEELEARHQKMDDFYKKALPRLENQLKYEELMTKIDRERFERFKMSYQMASAMAPPDEGQEKELGKHVEQPPVDLNSDNTGGERRLKKEGQN